MNLTEATTILGRFFRESAGGGVLSSDQAAELLAAWELVEPELPDADRIMSSWHIDDVGQALEDNFNVPADTLTDDEKRQVLKDVQESLDGSVGINWSTINAAIEHLFSDMVEEAQASHENGQQ